jgi:hypothetical protein
VNYLISCSCSKILQLCGTIRLGDDNTRVLNCPDCGQKWHVEIGEKELSAYVSGRPEVLPCVSLVVVIEGKQNPFTDYIFRDDALHGSPTGLVLCTPNEC